MLGYRARATVLAGLVLIMVLATAGCREDVGTAPEGEDRTLRRETAQCLAPPSDYALSDSAVVSSRLASGFIRTNLTAGVVCFSQEEGRWRLRSK